MKILFILPKIGSPAKWSVGVASLTAVLKEAGCQVELLEIETKNDLNTIKPFLNLYRPQIIGLSANSHQYIYARNIARWIKSNYKIPIFLGGVHSTLNPEAVVLEDCFDGICIGEAEDALLELVRRIENKNDYTQTKSFWFKRGDRVIKNDINKLIEDLDCLPFPDFSIFKFYKQAGQQEIVPRFIFSRGCPFNCTYCCNHAFKKIYSGYGQYLRFRSVDKSLEEIERAKEKYNFNHFKIDDDTFSLNKQWVLEFCKKYSKRFKMSFECNVRPTAVDEEILIALKGIGCNLIKVGVETGNEDLRKTILDRQISNDTIIKLFNLAKKIGISTFSFNMIGVPGETKKTIQDTINLNVKIQPSLMQVTAFYPYPDTLLGQKCIKEGLITKNHVDSYMLESILNLPDLTSEEIRKAVKNFKYNVYKKYDLKKALSEKLKTLKAFIVSRPVLYNLLRHLYIN